MNPDEALVFFQQQLTAAGLQLSELGIERGFAMMFDFYRNRRCNNCDADDDGDMLLYQWGLSGGDTHPMFELNLTRQFMATAAGDDEAAESDDSESNEESIWQLSLSFHLERTDALARIKPGNKWCSSPRPQAVDHFERFVRESPAYRSAAELRPAQVALDYFDVE